MANKSQGRVTNALKDIGWLIGNAESYSGYTGQSSDMFGFIDMIAVTPYRLVGIQACLEDYQQHIRKICPLNTARTFNDVSDTYLIGCKKVLAKKGGKQMKWAYRCGHFTNLSNGKVEYVEVCSWKDKNFDLEFLKELESKLSIIKLKEILTK